MNAVASGVCVICLQNTHTHRLTAYQIKSCRNVKNINRSTAQWINSVLSITEKSSTAYLLNSLTAKELNSNY